MKYAPPPDLTSIPPKTITPPTISSINSLDACSKPDFSTSTYSTPPPPPPPSFLQNESTKNLGAVENILAKLPTGFNSNITISGPQDIPLSKINRNLVTPNNTPADYFLTGSTFDANYQSTRDDSDAVLCSSTIDSSTSQSIEKNVTSSENFADIDLSQSSPSPVIRQTDQEQVASSAILFTPNFSSENKKTPIDFFSSSTTTESSFFDTKNSLQSVNTKSLSNTIQTEHQDSSNISLYNPLDYTSSSNNNNNINLQSEITRTSNLQPTVNDDGNISNWSIPPAALITSEMPEPTGTATLSPIQTSIYPLNSRTHNHNQQQQQDTIPPSLHNLAAGPAAADKKMQYRPVYHHWFYSVEVENKILWHPFSMHDSLNLEEIHNSNEITPETRVPTDGGRYDVEILKRQRSPVYWPGTPTEVKRSSWFYKGSSGSKYIPYDESIAARLEEEYKQACTNEHWNRKIDFNNGEYVVFHSPTIQIHYLQASTPELVASWGNAAVC